jgi:hypothetical protein
MQQRPPHVSNVFIMPAASFARLIGGRLPCGGQRVIDATRVTTRSSRKRQRLHGAARDRAARNPKALLPLYGQPISPARMLM